MNSLKLIIICILNMLFFANAGLLSLAAVLLCSFLIWSGGKLIEASRNKPIVLALCVVPLFVIWFLQKNNAVYVLGISFYMLQGIGYLADVKRGKFPAERNPLKLFAFLSFFPISVQGPICRYDKLMPQLTGKSTGGGFRDPRGYIRILFGFFKKYIIAERLAAITTVIFAEGSSFKGLWVLAGLLIYTLRLYNDFTGGIDIALGAAECFGITLPENFNKPMSARSLADYWRRWHISLAEWFKEYVFYPLSVFLIGLGIHSKGVILAISTLITWALTGLWHGLSPKYLVWGLCNGVILLLTAAVAQAGQANASVSYNMNKRGKASGLSVIATIFITSLLRVFDVYPSLSAAFSALGSIFTVPVVRISLLESFALEPADYVILVIAVAFVIWIACKSETSHPADYLQTLPTAGRIAVEIFLVLAVIVFSVYGKSYDVGGFIYGSFI